MTISTVHDGTGHIRNYSMFFDGLNRNVLPEENDWFDNKNIDTIDSPAIAPRKPMKEIRSFTKCNGYLTYGDKEAWVDGTEFYYDGEKQFDVTDTEKQMVEFNKHIIIYPDKIAFNIEEKTNETFESPDLDYITVYMNRIFGVKGNDIRACKLGDYKEWEAYKGVLTDSWATDVAGTGDFNGICVYHDHVMMFKENLTYELYGARPDQFELQEAYKVGVVNNKSVSEVASTLFFTGESGVYAYGGGFPRTISYKLKEKYVNATSFSDNRRYFLSLDNGDKKQTYIYDVELNAWSVYSDKYFNYYSYIDSDIGRKIRVISDENIMYELESGTGLVDWEIISQEFDDRAFQKKSVRKINFKALMDIGSSLEFYLSINKEPFKLVKTIKHTADINNDKREVKMNISLKRSEIYQIKIVGRGHSILYGEREVVFRSEK